MFNEYKRILDSHGMGADLTPITATEAENIRKRFPGLPETYIEFLKTIGCGPADGYGFTFFGGPVMPADVYDPETAKALTGYLLFGSDLSGIIDAFDTSADWSIVTIGDSGHIEETHHLAFEEYVRKVLMTELE